MFFLRKEMARAKRYKVPFSVLCFSVVETLSQDEPLPHPIGDEAVIEAVLNKLAINLREADVLGQLEKSRMVALLPMTDGRHARLVLRRCLRLLRTEPILVGRIPLTLKMAGVASGFDPGMKPDVDAFVEAMTDELEYLISRIRHIMMFL
jgi:GGDEF domain-containing protein